MQRLIVGALALLVVINLILFSLLGLKLYGRHARNSQYKTDAQQLLAAADTWRKTNQSHWPESCIIEPGTAELCPSGQDRDVIVRGSNLTDKYQIFIFDPPPPQKDSTQGDILNNPVVAYGLSQGALIVVNKTICFQGQELTASNGFAVIYGRETASGKQAACV